MKLLKCTSCILMSVLIIFAGCSPTEKEKPAKKEQPNPMQFLAQMMESYRDKVNGGIYHALSEDWSTATDTRKYCEDHFMLARTHVFQNMMTGDPAARGKAQELADFTIEKFEDKVNGGFFKSYSQEWSDPDREKSPQVLNTAFATLMHLYEITFDDRYLLKCFELLDLLLEKGWDKTHGGFFDSYSEEWIPTTTTKSVHTQMEIILHLAGAWKDGIDSPYAERAEYYNQKSVEITNLIIEKMYDHQQGGFFKSCTADWTVNDDSKDTEDSASAITTLFFIYQNLGPVLWGPRKGSHAYSPNRPINDTYSYRGPAPDDLPISMEAYNMGKIVVDLATLLREKAWDHTNGGFYTSCTRTWSPHQKDKSPRIQAACLSALNIAYKLSGESTVKTSLENLQKVLREKAQDPVKSGYFEHYSAEWKPLDKNKSFSTNLGVFGALGMTMGTVMGPPLPPVKLKVWIEPQSLSVAEGESAQYEVMIQNQGFAQENIRVGGMMALSRWMGPGEFHIDLAPHQVYTYTLKVTPPQGLRGKTYPFEISAIAESFKNNYFSDIALITIR